MTNREYLHSIRYVIQPVTGWYDGQPDRACEPSCVIFPCSYYYYRYVVNDIEVRIRFDGINTLIFVVRGWGANFNRLHTINLNNDDGSLEGFILSTTSKT